MIQPLLSILVPTVVGREEVFNRLMMKLQSTYSGDCVEYYYEKDNKEMTLGEKRQLMYQMASGLFSWEIDDDDDVADNAIQSIIDVIKLSGEYIDCITFQEHCIMNGKEYSSNHLLEYNDWEGDGNGLLWDGFHFHRTPFYKDVIKTEIARSVPFEPIRFGEDHAWSRALKPHLKKEVHIPRNIYYYIHNSKPEEFNERYGFNAD